MRPRCSASRALVAVGHGRLAGPQQPAPKPGRRRSPPRPPSGSAAFRRPATSGGPLAGRQASMPASAPSALRRRPCSATSRRCWRGRRALRHRRPEAPRARPWHPPGRLPAAWRRACPHHRAWPTAGRRPRGRPRAARAPARWASDRFAPCRLAPEKSAICSLAPARLAPCRLASMKLAPCRTDAPERSARCSRARSKLAPDIRLLAEVRPLQRRIVELAPRRSAPARLASARRAPLKSAPSALAHCAFWRSSGGCGAAFSAQRRRDAAQVGAGEARPVEVGPRQIGLAQVDAVEPGKAQVAAAQADRTPAAAASPPTPRSASATSRLRGKMPNSAPSAAAAADARLVAGRAARDGGDEEGDEGGAGENAEAEDQAARIAEAQAQEGAEEARLGAHQEHADQHQEGDVGEHDRPLHRGDRRRRGREGTRPACRAAAAGEGPTGEPADGVRKALRRRLRSGPAIACTKKKLSSSRRSGWVRRSVLSRRRSAPLNSSALRASSTNWATSPRCRSAEHCGRGRKKRDKVDAHLQERQHHASVQEQVAVGDAPPP